MAVVAGRVAVTEGVTADVTEATVAARWEAGAVVVDWEAVAQEAAMAEVPVAAVSVGAERVVALGGAQAEVKEETEVAGVVAVMAAAERAVVAVEVVMAAMAAVMAVAEEEAMAVAGCWACACSSSRRCSQG